MRTPIRKIAKKILRDFAKETKTISKNIADLTNLEKWLLIKLSEKDEK